jgi:ABC-type polysaccharide/polyol phosphate export permease
VATQLMFLVTPIFWRAEQIPDYPWLASYNPIFHLLEVCRAPMLGQTAPWNTWVAVALFNAVGCLFAFVVFARCRKRLAYWM